MQKDYDLFYFKKKLTRIVFIGLNTVLLLICGNQMEKITAKMDDMFQRWIS